MTLFVDRPQKSIACLLTITLLPLTTAAHADEESTDRPLELPAGPHVVRVRAVNGLGNSGGYSEAIAFRPGK